MYDYVLHSLYKWLNRRSGRRSYNWSTFKKMLQYFSKLSYLESVREILKLAGIRVVYYTSECITEEPDAVIPHVPVCLGSAQ